MTQQEAERIAEELAPCNCIPQVRDACSIPEHGGTVAYHQSTCHSRLAERIAATLLSTAVAEYARGIEAAQYIVTAAVESGRAQQVVAKMIATLLDHPQDEQPPQSPLIAAITELRRYVEQRGNENQKRAATTYGPEASWFSAKADTYQRIESKLDEILNGVQVEQSAWQPISSAPKDGTPILLTWHWDSGMHTGIGVVLASWICRTHSYDSRAHDCPREFDCEMGWNHYAGKMTHWQPLPLAPPSAAD